MIVAFIINCILGGIIGWRVAEYGTRVNWSFARIVGIGLLVYFPFAVCVSLLTAAVVYS